MLNISVSFALAKWMALVCVIWIGPICLGQLLMIAAETTTFESIKGHRKELCSCSSQGFNNIVDFLVSGNYKVDSTPMNISSYTGEDSNVSSYFKRGVNQPSTLSIALLR